MLSSHHQERAGVVAIRFAQITGAVFVRVMVVGKCFFMILLDFSSVLRAAMCCWHALGAWFQAHDV